MRTAHALMLVIIGLPTLATLLSSDELRDGTIICCIGIGVVEMCLAVRYAASVKMRIRELRRSA